MDITPESLRETLAAVLGVTPDSIDADANLVFLGLGSLEIMRLVTQWRRSGLAVDFDRLAAEPTITAWAKHLSAVTETKAVVR